MIDNSWRSMENYFSGVDDDQDGEENMDYKEKYKQLKRKLRYLIYENENFQDALSKAQKRLLVACKDRSFLLDRCALYERVDNTTSESDDTESSDGDIQDSSYRVDVKRRKIDSGSSIGAGYNSFSNQNKSSTAKKKRQSTSKSFKMNPTQSQHVQQQSNMQHLSSLYTNSSDGHLTPEDVERHLQTRPTFMEFLPDRAPPSIPAEMFSNDPSLDSESNDIGELETSPSNLGEDISVDNMMQDN